MGLTLYYAPGACSFVPHVALEEAGAEFDTVRLILADGDQRKPGYLSLNPKGRVPTLVVGDRPLTEVIAIVTYLDRRFTTAGVLPGHDPLLLARAYEVMTWLAATVHVAFAQITRPERYADDPDVRSALAAPGKARFIRALDGLETLAAAKDAWMIGETFTAVDSYALVVRRWAERIGVDLSAYPAWTAKGDRALARPSVVRVWPAKTRRYRQSPPERVPPDPLTPANAGMRNTRSSKRLLRPMNALAYERSGPRLWRQSCPSNSSAISAGSIRPRFIRPRGRS